MAFAIFLEDADLTAIETKIADNRLTNKQRNDGRVFWNGGLSAWRTAPRWPVEYPGYDASLGRIIVISGSSLASFRTYLYGLAQQSPAVADYLRKLADGFADHWGAVEPWPFTTGIDPWADYARQPIPPPIVTVTTPPPLIISGTTPSP
jgi:hypothetical protein